MGIVNEAKKLDVDDAIKLLEEKGKTREELMYLADLYMKKSEYEKILKLLNKMLEKEVSKELLMKRSVIYFKLNRKEDALNDILKAREIDKNDLSVIKGLIDVNASLGNYEDAMKEIEVIEKMNEVDQGIKERKGNLLKLMKLKAESDKYNFLIDAVRENIKNDRLLVAKSLFAKISEKRDAEYYETACVLYKKLGQPHEAVKFGEEALQKKLFNNKVLRAYAFALMDLHKFELAVEVFTRMLEKDNNDPRTFADRAVAEINIGDYESALDDIDKAIHIDPMRDIFYIRKGDIIARVHGIKKSIEYYNKAIKINPLNMEAYERKENAESILNRGANEYDKKLFR